MALKRSKGPSGTLIVLEHTSKILEDNPLGDPHVRKLAVWLPPQYDEGPGKRRFPVLYDLVGFTGSGLSHTNWKPFGDNVPERAARLIREQKMGPAIFVFPDCFTALGGNQYVNSSAIGNYADYLTREIIPFVDGEFQTLASREHRGCFGKSSGGYGSILLGLRRPDVVCAIADHSGDANFELCYLPDFPAALDAFREAGGPAAWLARFWADPNRRRTKFGKPLNAIGMAAHYSPNPDALPADFRIDWPFDLETGVFRPAVWGRWRAWDPIHLVDGHVDNLRKLRAIYIDCGTRDEWALHWGARTLANAIRAHGIAVRGATSARYRRCDRSSIHRCRCGY
jgi:hypothetical protein